MRNAFRLAMVVALVLTAGPAVAGKIGFIEVERALATVQEGKARLKELEEWLKPRNDEIAQQTTRLADLQRQLSQQQAIASPDALKKLQEEAIAAQRRLEDAKRDGQREFEAKQTEVLKEVARRINQVVTDYAKANDYDAVFIMKGSTLVYLAPTADLTDTIVRLYDQRFPLQK
jgi:outer membrane protein